MNEEERAASNRRMWIVLGGSLVFVALVVALTFLVGKSVGAPSEAFDREGLGRMAGEGMKQVGRRGEKEAAKVSATNEG